MHDDDGPFFRPARFSASPSGLLFMGFIPLWRRSGHFYIVALALDGESGDGGCRLQMQAVQLGRGSIYSYRSLGFGAQGSLFLLVPSGKHWSGLPCDIALRWQNPETGKKDDRGTCCTAAQHVKEAANPSQVRHAADHASPFAPNTSWGSERRIRK